ncbi:hypothetical protein PR048_026850 [Dryococelus australis]|uniref:Uncharacterized protein n=1 Tax=Dryococelus australis TaxID=614101 RepID=A0ABQ9GMI1_9NEOP|nr:hypothetical protein PR048_026850 [Dryococelus australis]
MIDLKVGLNACRRKLLMERREGAVQRASSPTRVSAAPPTDHDNVTYFPTPMPTDNMLTSIHPAESSDWRVSRPGAPVPRKLRGHSRLQTMPTIEEVPETPGEMQTVGEEVVLQLIPRSGDSLFAALALQLMGATADTDEHVRDTAKLRCTAGNQLAGNIAVYRILLLQSIAAHGDRYRMLQSDDERIHKYLLDLLRPGFPGGKECLQAVADVSHVNIAVYPEGSTRFVVRSRDPTAPREVAVAQRSYRARDDMPMPHYDSVTWSRPL